MGELLADHTTLRLGGPASGWNPHSARNASTSSGLATGYGMSVPSAPCVSWVPKICCSPRAIRTRSSSRAPCCGSASPTVTAAERSSRHSCWNSGCQPACCAIH